MLIINNSGPSNIVVTLYELCKNLVNPYFTFQLNRKGSQDVIYFTNNDTSTSPGYWNQFEIIPATSSIYGLTQGIIPLISGEYIYTVWETTNQYDLNLSTVVGMVESGILIYLGSSSIIPDFTQNNSTTIPVFRRN
jgi:hypothetical protein